MDPENVPQWPQNKKKVKLRKTNSNIAKMAVMTLCINKQTRQSWSKYAPFIYNLYIF